MSTAMMKNVAGAKVKIVPGYPGSTDIRLAIERRELDGVCDSWQSLKSTKAEWVQDKKVNLLVQMAAKPHPDMAKVPTIMEFAAPNLKTALDLLVSPGESGRSFVGPPGVPADRLDILRRAFDASVKDKEFLDTTAKSRLDVEPMPGEEIEKFLNRIYKASSEDVATARKLIQ
jgi:tripartite-type tricarboxylate transporter receptor subunit TctC